MEEDWEYRQALIDEGYDPDDPVLRQAIADTVALLRSIGTRNCGEAEGAAAAPRAQVEVSRQLRLLGPSCGDD